MSAAPFLDELIRKLVSNPAAVEVEEEVDGHTRTFHITVDPDDTGKVIGKSGKVINAIRQVVSAIAAKGQERAFVKINTPD